MRLRRLRSAGRGRAGRRAEAPLVDALRASRAWIPGLSLVASTGSRHVCTAERGRAVLSGQSVRPDAARVARACRRDALGEPLVALLGSTAYYPRFGFRLASEYGITPKEPRWVPDFQVRTLTAYDPGLRGPFAYPEPFDYV